MGRSQMRGRAGRRRRRLWLLAVAGACLVGFLYYRPVQAYLETQDALAKRADEVRRLAAEQQTLQRRLALDESGATLMREARRLGLVRPGEQLFIVKDIPAWRKAAARVRDR